MSGAGTAPAGAANEVFGLPGRWSCTISIGAGTGRPPAPEAPQAGSNRPTIQASGVMRRGMASIDRSGKLPAAYRLFIVTWCNDAVIDGAPQMDGLSPPQPGECCILGHRVFTLFSDPLFRRAETDGMPAMVVMLGERQAVVPLRS